MEKKEIQGNKKSSSTSKKKKKIGIKGLESRRLSSHSTKPVLFQKI
jgi:hypothetical protein